MQTSKNWLCALLACLCSVLVACGSGSGDQTRDPAKNDKKNNNSAAVKLGFPPGAPYQQGLHMKAFGSSGNLLTEKVVPNIDGSTIGAALGTTLPETRRVELEGSLALSVAQSSDSLLFKFEIQLDGSQSGALTIDGSRTQIGADKAKLEVRLGNGNVSEFSTVSLSLTVDGAPPAWKKLKAQMTSPAKVKYDGRLPDDIFATALTYACAVTCGEGEVRLDGKQIGTKVCGPHFMTRDEATCVTERPQYNDCCVPRCHLCAAGEELDASSPACVAHEDSLAGTAAGSQACANARAQLSGGCCLVPTCDICAAGQTLLPDEPITIPQPGGGGTQTTCADLPVRTDVTKDICEAHRQSHEAFQGTCCAGPCGDMCEQGQTLIRDRVLPEGQTCGQVADAMHGNAAQCSQKRQQYAVKCCQACPPAPPPHTGPYPVCDLCGPGRALKRTFNLFGYVLMSAAPPYPDAGLTITTEFCGNIYEWAYSGKLKPSLWWKNKAEYLVCNHTISASRSKCCEPVPAGCSTATAE